MAYIELLKLNYNEIIKYLKNKYGEIKKSYFHNNKNYQKNKSISRAKDGLFIHHIMENMYIELSSKECAKYAPWDAQLGENLVYCDWLEHLILHVKIVEEYMLDELLLSKDNEKLKIVGLGGIFNFIIPQLNDYYSGFRSNYQEWTNKLFYKVQNYKNEYLQIIKYTYDVILKIDKKINNLGNLVLIDSIQKFTLFDFKKYIDPKRFYSSMGFLTKDGWDCNNNIKLYKKIKNLINVDFNL